MPPITSTQCQYDIESIHISGARTMFWIEVRMRSVSAGGKISQERTSQADDDQRNR